MGYRIRLGASTYEKTPPTDINGELLSGHAGVAIIGLDIHGQPKTFLGNFRLSTDDEDMPQPQCEAQQPSPPQETKREFDLRLSLQGIVEAGTAQGDLGSAISACSLLMQLS